MSITFSRRDAVRWAGASAMATTFLPLPGRYRAWSHPAQSKLQTRQLGRTGREVTTFGLGGVTCLLFSDGDAVALIVKTVRAGVTYLDTANAYGDSQLNYGKAFRILNLIPGEPGYDAGLRSRLFLASKTGLRYSIIRDGSSPARKSQDGARTAVDHLMRSLTQVFGDGKGSIPDGAYLDLMQIHNTTEEAHVDAVYEGLENPGDKSLPRVGALAGLLDFRDGTNQTGLNPAHKKWIRHIGITTHENPTALMYAMRRDKTNILDTLLTTVNPNDPRYFCCQTNALAVAAAKNMGVIGMKIFADGVFFGRGLRFGVRDWVKTVGQEGKVPYGDFLHYALSARGLSTVVIGIGETDKNNDPQRDQFVADLAACQVARPLSPQERSDIEDRVAALHGTRTNFFQRPSSGLLPPQNVKARRSGADGAVEIFWDTAYAAGEPIVRYEVFRRDECIARLPFEPQISEQPFQAVDRDAPSRHFGGLWYRVRAVDASGAAAESLSVRVS